MNFTTYSKQAESILIISLVGHTDSWAPIYHETVASSGSTLSDLSSKHFNPSEVGWSLDDDQFPIRDSIETDNHGNTVFWYRLTNTAAYRGASSRYFRVVFIRKPEVVCEADEAAVVDANEGVTVTESHPNLSNTIQLASVINWSSDTDRGTLSGNDVRSLNSGLLIKELASGRAVAYWSISGYSLLDDGTHRFTIEFHIKAPAGLQQVKHEAVIELITTACEGLAHA